MQSGTHFFSLLEIVRYSVRKSPAVPGTPGMGPWVDKDESIIQGRDNPDTSYLPDLLQGYI